MSHHLPALIVIVPLLTAMFVSGAGWVRKRLCFPLAVLGLGITLISAVGILVRILEHGTIHYRLGGWAPPWGILYEVDGLNGLVLSVISAAAFINLIASRKSIESEFPQKEGAFFTLYILFVAGLMGIVATGDLFNLYVLLEITSLTGYALIALGRDPAPLSSLHYLLMGTIGASFYLLGIGYLYIMTGSLNMADISNLLADMTSSPAVLAAFVLCMTGVWIKMAFFPLHLWLPNAYTHAPGASSSLLAPLMTKAMVYVMIRLMLSVFTPGYAFHVLDLSFPLVWLATLAILAGALLALAQRNVKRMLCYILISEIGYMVGGAWLGNRAAMTGAILHIVNDAAMTLCLFLVVNNVFYKVQGLSLANFRGLSRTMPWTTAAMVTGALSFIGVPPTCGFFSKWYLLSGAVQAGRFEFVVALLLSSLVNAILFFRIIEIMYYDSAGGEEGHGHGASIQEAPLEMLVPLLVVALGTVFIGLYTGDIVALFIERVIPMGVT
ncbi:MAG: proton-conducting transporter membrane subunit [Desulfobacteraceae bacterium]|jgi:multicomponent Na+:H+ antiporter subunit D